MLFIYGDFYYRLRRPAMAQTDISRISVSEDDSRKVEPQIQKNDETQPILGAPNG